MSIDSNNLYWTTTLPTFRSSPLLFTIQRICFVSALFVFFFTVKDSIQNDIAPSFQNISLIIGFLIAAIIARTPKRHISLSNSTLEVGDSVFGIPASYKSIKKNEKSMLLRRKQNKRWTSVEIVNENSSHVLTYMITNTVDEILLIHKLKTLSSSNGAESEQ